MSDTESQEESQEEPQVQNATPSVDDLLGNLEAQIRQEIAKWWNDVKHLRPESLPWFSHGIKGLVRKLYYNNSKENPDWNNYKAKEESVVKMSLAEYGLIRGNLQSLIEQEAPAGADDAINLLIKRLMPVIKSGFEQIASMHQSAAPTPTVTTQEQPPEVAPEAAPVAKRPPTNKKAAPVVQTDPIDDKTGSEDASNTSNTAVPTNSNEPPDNSGSTGSDGSGSSGSAGAPPAKPPQPPNEGSWYSKNLMSYLASPKEKDDKEKLISSLSEVGLAGKTVGKGKRIDIDINPQDPDNSAEAIVKFFEHLAKEDPSDLAKLGLKEQEQEKNLLNSDDGEAPFYHSYEFYDSLASNSKNKFAIFGITKELKHKIHEYLEKNVYTAQENYVSKLKRMLSENSEENLNLILAKQVPFEKKKEFFLEKIRSK